MKKMTWWLFAAIVLCCGCNSVPIEAVTKDSDAEDASQAVSADDEPSVDCGKVTYAGVCEGNVLKFCRESENKLSNIDCAKVSATCGWDDIFKYNTCLFSKGAYPPGELLGACADVGATECVKKGKNEIRICAESAGVMIWVKQKCDDANQCTKDKCAGGVCQFEYACAKEEYCRDGECSVVCVPDCESQECGSDGCGGSCGSCSNYWGTECDLAVNKCRLKCDNGMWCDADEQCCKNACIPEDGACCEIEGKPNIGIWCNASAPVCVTVPEDCGELYNTQCCPEPHYDACYYEGYYEECDSCCD